MRPLMESFFRWVREARASALGRTLATKALGYAANQEPELLRVLDDAKLPLDNTRAERALRKIVVGRKAWMFYGSDTHAEAAAALFSLIASCRLHQLDPFAYLEEVMRVLPYWPDDRRGQGEYFRTSNAAWSFNQIDSYVYERLRGLRVKRAGRQLDGRMASKWTREYFHHLGLHRLRDTIAYPEATQYREPESSPASRVRTSARTR